MSGLGGGAPDGAAIATSRGELDHMADVGLLSRFAATKIPPVQPWIPLGVAAFAAVGTALVAAEGRRLGTGLLLLVVVLLAVPAWRRPVSGRFGWLVPAVVRAIEYGLIVRVVAVVDPDAVPAAFALLCAIAYHHYDTVYRWRYQRRGPRESVFSLGLGWDGRLVLLALLLLVDVGLNRPLLVLAVAFGVLFVAESAMGWRRWLRRASFTPSA
ncbi:MAG: DUF5941 domain-containing protein [Sporichthyaceae bacterium]